MSLSANVHRLTRDHLDFIDGNGTMAPALLAELRQAVEPGQNSSAGDGGSSAVKIPINDGAIDLLREIEVAARKDWADAHGDQYAGQLEQLLQAFADEDMADEWAAYMEHATRDWCDDIEKFLRPTKPRRKIARPCPSCSQTFYGEERAICLSLGCWDGDEELRHVGTWDVRCEACGAEWAGENMGWLIASLDAPGGDVARVS